MMGWGWAVFSVLLALASVPGTLWYFWPDVGVSPSLLLDTQNPFSILFTIENKGHVTLSKIEFTCDVNEIRADYIGHMDIGGEALKQRVPQLPPNEAATVPCDLKMRSGRDVRVADLTTVVAYSLWLVPLYRSEFRLRFVGTLVDGKEWQWVRQPTPPPPEERERLFFRRTQ